MKGGNKLIKGFKPIGLKFHKQNNNLERGDKPKRAFTIIELIVVMAVIAILVLLAAPKFLGYTQKAEETKYIHTAKVIETALDAYLINGGEIGDGLTIVDSTLLDEGVTNKNLINTKGYMVSVDVDTYYELTDSFIKANLDVKLSASNSTSFIIEAHAAKSIKAPNAVYASSDGVVIINKEQMLKGYVDTIIEGGDVELETPVEETPVEETPVEEAPVLNCTTDATAREYFTFDALTGTITGYSLTGPKDVIIPCEIDGVAVKIIGDGAFQSKGLTSMIILGNVTSINKYAFRNNLLTNAIISDNVTTIGSSAFEGNPLIDVTIGTNVSLYNNSAYESFPKNFKVGYATYFNTAGTYRYDTATAIWKKDNCDSSYILDKTSNTLTAYFGTEKDLIIPDEIIMDGVTYPVKVIGSAFNGKGLTSVVIPNSVTSIGGGAFANNALTSVIVPNSVTSIGGSSFAKNSLTKVVISDSVTTIGSSAFEANPLTNVTIGTNVSLYNNSAYESFPKNFRVGYATYLNNAGTYRYDTAAAVWKKDNCDSSYILNKATGAITTYFGTDKDLIIPDEIIMDGITYPVKVIGNSAFNSKGLTSVVIPNSITSIESGAFAYNALTSVIIPDSVVKIDNAAFNTNPLTSVIIGNSVKTIGERAFTSVSLATITIGSNVALATHTVYVPFPRKFKDGYEKYFSTAGTYRYDTMAAAWKKDNCDSSYILDKTSNTITAYYGTEKDLVIPDEIIMDGVTYPVKAIGNSIFNGKGLTSVVIPNSVTTIGTSAFSNNSLTSVTMGNSVKRISTNAFYGNNLVSIQIPTNIEFIDTGAFKNNGPSKNSGSFTTIGAKTWTLIGTTWN